VLISKGGALPETVINEQRALRVTTAGRSPPTRFGGTRSASRSGATAQGAQFAWDASRLSLTGLSIVLSRHLGYAPRIAIPA
jgi:hypothetical protein